MIPRTHTQRWWAVVLVLMVVATATVTAAVAAPSTTPQQQPTACTWQGIGNANKATYYAASAMDTDNNQMYVYGGLDQTLATQDSVQKIDLSGASISPAPHVIVTGVSSLKRYASAGAYRSRGDESAVYFIGGSGDVRVGAGTDDVQRYNVKTKQWSKITTSGTFEDRAFHAATYDPGHDVIWVTGGIAKCGLDDIANNRCAARTLAIKYLEFDDAAGTATWRQLSGSGPTALYGHTMVLDSTGNQLIVVGGSRDGRQGSNTVWALDLSDADVSNAKWSQLSVGGVTLPKLALHGAAYDASHNWVVVYGGVTSNFNTPNENTSTATYALDLNANPPEWKNLGISLQQRVGSVVEFAPLHQVTVLNGGRRASKASPPQDVKRDSFGLSCADQPTQAPTSATSPATSTTVPTAATALPSPPTPVVTPTTPPTPGGGDVQVCAFIMRFRRVPPAVISAALANPDAVFGYNLNCNPSIPPNMLNRPRRYLSIHDTARPWHPLYNSLEMKCGCP